jgi:hypothetical protein
MQGYILREIRLHVDFLEHGRRAFYLLPLCSLPREQPPIQVPLEPIRSNSSYYSLHVYVLDVGLIKQPEKLFPSTRARPDNQAQHIPSDALDIYQEPTCTKDRRWKRYPARRLVPYRSKAELCAGYVLLHVLGSYHWIQVSYSYLPQDLSGIQMYEV